MKLIHNPQKLRKLVEEIEKTFPTSDDAVTFATTQDLPYLNAVLLETMRLMTHAPSQ
jgi:cytochrome P450